MPASLAPTAGKSEPLREAAVRERRTERAAQPLVVHKAHQLPPSIRTRRCQPIKPGKDQSQHSQSLTQIHSVSHSHQFFLIQDLDLSLSEVGKLLTPVFLPSPNSIANLFLPSTCFQLTQKNKFVSVWLFLWLMNEKSTSLSHRVTF